MNYDYEYNGTNENIPSFQERNNFTTNNMNIEPPRKRRKWPIILLILLLLIVGVLIYLTFFTDKLDFVKPNDKYSEFDPNKGKIESNSNLPSNIVSNSNIESNSNKNSNNNIESNSNKNSNSNSNINKEVTSINITPNTPSVVVGSKVILKATITPNDAKDKNVTWKSSNTSIATVNAKGEVTGVKVGTATITATSKNGKSASVNITVSNKKIPVTGIYLEASSKIIDNQQTYKIRYHVFPTNATNQEVTFTSDTPGVAKVSADGVITPVGVGTAVITVTTKDGNRSDKFTVFVKELDVQSISIIGLDGMLYVGNKKFADVTYYPSTATNGKKVTWKSSNTSVATVNDAGQVTGLKEGNTLITATTANGKTASRTVNVRLNPSNYGLQINKVVTTKAGYETTTCYLYFLKSGSASGDFKTVTYNGKNYESSTGVTTIKCSDVNTSITSAKFTSQNNYVVNNIKVSYSGYN